MDKWMSGFGILVFAGLAFACASNEDPSDPVGTQLPEIPVRIETPGPMVDLDPSPGNPDLFAWYYTPPPGQPGFPTRTKLAYSGSVFDTMNDDNECEFRVDFIGGKEVTTFNVWDENKDKMDDGRKVRLEGLGDDKRVKIVLTIEWDTAGNRLNWVIDDLSDERPACTMKPVTEFEVGVVPEEFQGLLRETFRETSGTPRGATDFKFWVTYEQ